MLCVDAAVQLAGAAVAVLCVDAAMQLAGAAVAVLCGDACALRYARAPHVTGGCSLRRPAARMRMGTTRRRGRVAPRAMSSPRAHHVYARRRRAARGSTSLVPLKLLGPTPPPAPSRAPPPWAVAARRVASRARDGPPWTRLRALLTRACIVRQGALRGVWRRSGLSQALFQFITLVYYTARYCIIINNLCGYNNTRECLPYTNRAIQR